MNPLVCISLATGTAVVLFVLAGNIALIAASLAIMVLAAWFTTSRILWGTLGFAVFYIGTMTIFVWLRPDLFTDESDSAGFSGLFNTAIAQSTTIIGIFAVSSILLTANRRLVIVYGVTVKGLRPAVMFLVLALSFVQMTAHVIERIREAQWAAGNVNLSSFLGRVRSTLSLFAPLVVYLLAEVEIREHTTYFSPENATLLTETTKLSGRDYAFSSGIVLILSACLTGLLG